MFIRVVLPAPFSPSRQWISPGSTVEVDVVVGNERAETFGQAAQLELHRAPSSSAAGDESGRQLIT